MRWRSLRAGAEAVQGNRDQAFDLLGLGAAQAGDAADHLGDVGDVDVGADHPVVAAARVPAAVLVAIDVFVVPALVAIRAAVDASLRELTAPQG